ncbi:MAG: hypothetical protein ACREH8_11445 [Opitutaceae bacterium]
MISPGNFASRWSGLSLTRWSVTGRCAAKVVRLGVLGALVATLVLPATAEVAERATVIVVAGAPGEAEFAPDIALQMDAWSKVSAQAGARHIGIGASDTDRERVKAALEAEAKTGPGEFWLVLAGHGTFDGREAKLNLRGPDLSATDLAEWLKPFERPMAVIDTTSSSAPFLARLAAPKRVVVSATRSGYEQNYARFGKFFAEALGDSKSDLDKDGQISLLESFLSASHRTTEFYKTEGRLSTEHALVDDNGDGLGTPADWFRGVLATKRAKDGATPDGARAHQFHLVRSEAEQQLSATVRARRDRLELELSVLREKKPKMNEEKYYQELEKLLLQLAAVYDGT